MILCPKPKHIPITGTKSQNLFPSDADTGRPVTDIQVGDIVFIESQSSQSPYIKLGTMSKWTHCGVVVDTPDGLKVLEASKTVKLTPFNTFIGRAKVKKLMQKRNIRMDQELVAPVDIYKARRIQASCTSYSPEIR